MIKVGIIGLGFMGQTHFKIYQKLPNVKIVAIADEDAKRAKGDLSGTWGNLGEGVSSQLPMDGITGVTNYADLLKMPDVDVVDVCLPTPAHPEAVLAALAANKHVACEKPLARTSADARKIAAAVSKSSKSFMPAMCMRFWPEWAWLKKAVAEKRYGKVLGASFHRLSSIPGGWFRDGKKSGGALLDLHIHDTDFVCYLFGRPKSVFSRGYTKGTGEIDHVATHYAYDDVPLVYAEGGWVMQDGFGFRMRYSVNFENATAEFDLANPDPLTVVQNGKREPVACEKSDGWTEELKYFIDCVSKGKKPETVTAQDALQSVEVVEAEGRSIASGQAVQV